MVSVVYVLVVSSEERSPIYLDLQMSYLDLL